MQNKTELSFNDRVAKVYRRISRYFSVMPEEKYVVADPLIQSYAFYKVELEELEKVIAADGATEKYRNGESQQGMKLSAAITAHLKVQKNMQTTAKKLLDMLPSHIMFEKVGSWTNERVKMQQDFKEYIIDGERSEEETFDQWRARKAAMFEDPEDYYEDYGEDDPEDTDDPEEVFDDLKQTAEG